MATVSAGSTGTYTLTGTEEVTLTLGSAEYADVFVTRSGRVIFSQRITSSRSIGQFVASDVVSITAIGGDVDYTANSVNTAYGLSAAQVAALTAATDAGFGGSSMPSVRYWAHCFAPFQGNQDGALYDQSGQQNDGTLGTTLSKAEAWATAGFASTVDLGAGEDQSVFRFPALSFDYAAGESLCFFWKGQITPEGSTVVFFGTSAFSSTQGFGFRVTTSGKLDFFLSPGASGAIFGNSTTAAPFAASETHSVCVFIDGVTRQYAVYVDGAADLALQSLGAGVSIDTKTAVAVSLGTGFSGAGTTGIATKTQALAVLRRAAGLGLPTDLAGIARALHRNPSKLISASAW